MTSQIKKPPTSWPLIILFIIIIISVIIFGAIYYNYEKDTLLLEKQQELSSISDLKIRQITQWRFERLADGTFLGSNTLIVNKMLEYLNNTKDIPTRDAILQSLILLIENFDYNNIILTDRNGDAKLSFPFQDTLIGDHLRPLLPEIARNRQEVLTDLHLSNYVSFVHMDLIIPLIDRSNNDLVVRGFLVLRIDPQKVLYPLIQSWPAPSRSAETLIVRKEGDAVVYLNKLRHIKNNDMILKKPISMEKLPAAMAFKGIRGTIDGRDYRNVPVVASMKKIPGTQWYMVAKMDRDEVFSVLESQMKLVITILVLFISTIGLFLGFLMWNQRVRFYRGRYEDELNQLALFKHFDYILKFANDIILLFDKDLNIVEANDRALEVYMYKRDELIGMNLSKIQAPATVTELPGQIELVDEVGSSTYETLHMRKDKSVFPLEISSRAVNIEGSKYYQNIGRDITERKHAEATLRESELRFRKIFEESPFPMFIAGKDLGIIRTNAAFCRMTGYDEEELKFHTFNDLTYSENGEDDQVSLMRLIAEDIPVFYTEKRYIRKDGSVILGSVTISIIRNNKDEAQFFLGMVEDITLRREAEAALEKSFSLIKATLESTEDGFLVVDLSGNIVQFNQRYTEMWRIPREILETGKDEKSLHYVKDQLINPVGFIDSVMRLYSEPEAITSDLLEFKDGRYFERYSQPQKINDLSVGRVWSFRDITEKKKAESELIAAKVKAEESDRLKTAFLHNVSHEIRTPMNAIIGFSSLLNEPDLKEADRQLFTEIISQSSNQLLSIINDIVDIANIESEQVKVNMLTTDLNSSLKSLREQFIYKERQNKIPVNLSLGLPDAQAIIITDNTKLIQILSNLINNSLKFTREGHIDFGYILNGNFLEFFVRDTGIGIPEESIGKVFERFYQVDRTISRQFGGTGLGLSICRAYVRLLGGSISVTSEPGKGTTFVFTIQYLPAS